MSAVSAGICVNQVDKGPKTERIPPEENLKKKELGKIHTHTHYSDYNHERSHIRV